MSSNLKSAMEESWPDHSPSNSFIDLDISFDVVKDYAARPSSFSRQRKAKETGKGNAWYAKIP